MQECRTYGSVRGVGGNAHPYRDSVGVLEHGMIKQIAARASARPDAAGRNFDAIPAERHGEPNLC